MNPAQPGLYPPLEPFVVQHLPVGGRHALYLEQCGSAEGFPALFLHGGPGSRTRALHRRYFDPRFYRIVLFDQRGCGRSTPAGCTEDNTTRHLVEDIEALRRHLGFERMLLFGGSWGAALALAYAGAHPARVAAMVLRGVFLGTRAEVDAYLGRLPHLVPHAWAALAQGPHGELLAHYHALVNQDDERMARAAAQRWIACEDAVMGLGAADGAAGATPDPVAALARARVQLHYLVHDCFLAPAALASGLARLAHAPVLIVQGGLDLVCPPQAARELATRLPHAELR
ncbi:MAG: alpha/beta fold hydrolase, partial [Woeseiaceae bacterium]